MKSWERIGLVAVVGVAGAAFLWRKELKQWVEWIQLKVNSSEGLAKETIDSGENINQLQDESLVQMDSIISAESITPETDIGKFPSGLGNGKNAPREVPKEAGEPGDAQEPKEAMHEQPNGDSSETTREIEMVETCESIESCESTDKENTQSAPNNNEQQKQTAQKRKNKRSQKTKRGKRNPKRH